MPEINIKSHVIQKTNFDDRVVSGQTGCDVYKFILPKVVDGTDLSGEDLTWYVSYENKNGTGDSVLLAKSVDGDNIALEWTPDATATSVFGPMDIQVYASKLEDGVATKRWLTRSTTIYVHERLNPEAITPAGPTVFEQYLSQIQALDADVSTKSTNAAQSATEANASKEAAKTSETNAKTSETNAKTSETNAGTSATESANSATSSAESATASANSATASANSATESANSATASETAKADSFTAKNDAVTAKDDAITAQKGAETAQGKAETAQKGAETAESNVLAIESGMSCLAVASSGEDAGKLCITYES